MASRLWGGSPLARPSASVDGSRCILRHQSGAYASFDLTRADRDLSDAELEALVIAPAIDLLRANVRAKSTKKD